MDLQARHDKPAQAERETDRYRLKRDEIVAAAARQIAERGLKGLTLVGVAGMVGLSTNSVTYYFRRKELLAEAAVEDALARFAEVLAPDSPPSTPRDYLRDVLARNFALAAATRRGEAPPLTVLSEVRALEEPARTRLIAAYFALVARVSRRFGEAGGDAREKGRAVARAQLLCDLLHWARTWLRLYAIEDFPRVEARLFDLMDRGLAQPGARWAPPELPFDQREPAVTGTNVEAYLRVATRLVNLRGYRGASVERIAGELQLSKGSFYHHLNGKDDLVRACFDRSFNRVSARQHCAFALEGSYWDRLCGALSSLLELQVLDEQPLLRDTALLALPEEMRRHAINRSDRVARRFAGLLSDGISEGSIRPIDPLIASQCLIGLVNSASDMAPRSHRWPSRAALIEDYAGPLLFGFFR
ncbi:transcriptional regulator, TetR family [Pseudooceanicola antarcticus]|uniref:TetR family transcriptional regulator n=1 Tax=Pseudooceanicola antarcticus TaxID=1247613 RepID=A0A285IKS0_9RHOB|nr:TetR family transcriptional regulator [Pseudooceanicola antarcticus]PJE28755.1 TetR family transcriptional regulator [Pseudooceanicola antarcticus]SNY48347.1 transcriptional regulator, TetR family [Pseudooceanicola antarcticus]